VQAQGMGGRPVVYKGMLDCFRQILRHEGGCSSAAWQGFRVQGVYRAVLDCFRQILRHEGGKHLRLDKDCRGRACWPELHTCCAAERVTAHICSIRQLSVVILSCDVMPLDAVLATEEL
jgi:hypothetical protein